MPDINDVLRFLSSPGSSSQLEQLLAVARMNDPLFSSPPVQPRGGIQIPGLGQTGSMMAGLMAEGVIRNMLPQGAYSPGRLFSNQNSVSQAYQRRDFTAMQSDINLATQQDMRQWETMLRGTATALGTRYDPAAGQHLMQDFRPVANMLAMVAPDAYSLAHGGRDMASMSREVFLGARWNIDPVTGRQRLTEQSRQTLNQEMYKHMFGPDRDPMMARGMSSYQIGGLYNQLTAAGMGPRALSREEQRRELQAEAGGGEGITAADQNAAREALTVMSRASTGPESTRLQQAVQSFDARRTRRFMADFTKAFTHIQDMLTDMGHGEATPQELLGIMQGVTGNGMTVLSREQLARTMGQVAELQHTTGMTLPNFIRLRTSAQQFTDRLGLHPVVSTQAALAGAYAGNAYRATFGETGVISPEQAALAAANQRAEAEASSGNMQLIATERLVKEFGEDALTRAPTLRAAYNAARNNQTHFRDASGRMRPVVMQEGEWEQEAGRAFGANVARNYRMSTGANLAFSRANPRFGDLVARSASDLNLPTQLQGTLLDPEMARLAAEMNLPPEELARLVTAGFRRDAREGIGLRGAGDINATKLTTPEGIGETVAPLLAEDYRRRTGRTLTAEQQGRLRGTITSRFNELTSDPRYADLGQLQQTNDAVEQQRRASTRLQTELLGQLRGDVSGLNRNTMMGRLIDVFQNASSETTAMQALAGFTGAVPDEAVRGRVNTNLRRLYDLYNRARAAEAGGNPEELRRLREEMGHAAAVAGEIVGDTGGPEGAFQRYLENEATPMGRIRAAGRNVVDAFTTRGGDWQAMGRRAIGQVLGEGASLLAEAAPGETRESLARRGRIYQEGVTRAERDRDRVQPTQTDVTKDIDTVINTELRRQTIEAETFERRRKEAEEAAMTGTAEEVTSARDIRGTLRIEGNVNLTNGDVAGSGTLAGRS